MKSIIATAALCFLATTSAFAATPADTDPSVVSAGAYTVEPRHTRVQFSVSHLGFTNWNGDLTGTSGSLTLDPKNVGDSKVDVKIPVASISTTNTTLDGELKSASWLDASKYPTIHFISTKVVQTAPSKATITGDLTFHGVTKPVVLDATFNGAGVNPLDKNYTVGFDATATIKRSDFGVMTYLPLIGDDTTLRISAAFVKGK